MAYQLKFVANIAISRLVMKAEQRLQILAKQRTGSLHELVMEMPKPQRAKQDPPFTIVVDASFEAVLEIAFANDGDASSWMRRDIS